ncbi:ABC transporter substrate-binding protein [Promineifilum sp.]|uniref:ABC transporter substrate-binding protein n=1 Tax=Promineifilum sp. TaxID=2664178 RepID=UPI0035ADDA45
MKRRSWWLLVVWSLILALALAACGGGAAEPPAGDAGEVAEPTAETAAEEPTAAAEEPADEGAAAEGDNIIIKLAENPWSASMINANVARILLEEELGYPVEIVTIDENAQWASLATGDLHASLEVWPSGHAENVAQYIDDQGVVENGGLLGPVGKIGWYIPSYMVERNPALATWEGFQDPAAAAEFATAETGDLGQFLAGDPSWVQYDADIITNLELPLQVVNAGSEQAILAALDAAYSREEPILFYFWTPHSIHAKYELTEVALPEHTEACYAEADTGGVACDYPGDDLFKIFWAGLAEAAPDAYTLLKNMNYSTEDQITMVAAVELDGKTADEAAREWLAANEATWRAWMPAE